jgi:hypothetical protein
MNGIKPPSRPVIPPPAACRKITSVIVIKVSAIEMVKRTRGSAAERPAPAKKLIPEHLQSSDVSEKKLRSAEGFGSLEARAKSLKELSPKSGKFARPDSLPDAPHGVKEEREVVVRQKDARQHLARREEVTQVGA